MFSALLEVINLAVMQAIQKPNVIYIHTETTNQSFIDMRNYLKSKGIQNNDFFLALYDSGLAGIDPRDPNLPTHMKQRVLMECTKNYWYFIREVIRIPEQGAQAGSGARYGLHRGNLAMNFLFVLNFNQFVELPRQFGKTTAALARYLWVYNFGTTNSEIMFAHKDHTGSKSNLAKMKGIREALPSYLQMESAINAEGKKLKVQNTVVAIQNPYNSNKITTVASARSRDSASNLGRGSTMPIQYYDEFAWAPFCKDIYLAAAPAFSRASQNAQRNNAPYGMLITTTPGDLLTESGAYAYEMRNKCTKFEERFYDFTYPELVELRNLNNESAFFLITYTYQQLGAGQDYFKRMVLEMNASWREIRREVMLEWAEATSDCPFEADDLDKIKLHLREPIRYQPIGRKGFYAFQIYDNLDTTYPPIIGVDVAGASYNDSSAITIIDSHTTKVTATLNYNFMPSDDLADVLVELVMKYLPNGIINIERNGGFGVSVIQRICKTPAKANLYWEVKDKVVEEAFNGVRLEKRSRKVKVYGTDSTKSVRARLIEILFERVRYHKDKFIAPIIHQEMSGMQTKRNGKVEHSDQTHDDQVFSYLMALYVWYDGKDLAERYHIQKNVLKTDENEELEEAEFGELYDIPRENLDFERFVTDDTEKSEEIAELLEFIEKNSQFINTTMYSDNEYFSDIAKKNQLLRSNRKAREALTKQNGIDPLLGEDAIINGYTTLPQSIFDMSDSDTQYDEFGNPILGRLQGNLAHMWDQV